MIFKLTRPEPALPQSYFGPSWDHSTGWAVEDPGLQTFGSYNSYLKTTESFIEEHRLLTDLAAGLGIKGIAPWGFLRDSHGGVEAAKKVASHAMDQGVYIMPGIGTTWYGGIYFEGNHPYNIDTFLKKNPSAKSLSMVRDYQGVCPSNPLFKEWMEEGLDWLFDTFDIGGANFENGDFFLCGCDDCKAHKENWPKEDPEFFRLQALGYKAPLEHLAAIAEKNKDYLISWATYTGFLPGMEAGNMTMTPYMGCERPALFDDIKHLHTTQFTLTRMVRQDPLPLTDYLENGVPEGVFDNDCWPRGLVPPVAKSVGFLHQGSQWRGHSRYDQVVSTIKEACLRASLSGLEGVSIHGDMSALHIPAALNYLAFSHFTHWPMDSLLEFGRKTLGEVFHSESEGEAFAEIFAHWDAGCLTDEHKAQAAAKRKDLIRHVQLGSRTANATNLVRFRFWCWLHEMIQGHQEAHTANFF